MIKKDFIIKSLFLNGTLSTSEIVDKFYDDFSFKVDEKRVYYISKGIEKTEKELRQQIYAEFGQNICANPTLIETSKERGSLNKHNITELGKKYYLESKKDEEEDVEVVSIENIEEEDVDTFGIVYLLKSKSFEDTYKVGKTKNITQRLSELSKDHRYGVFNLTEIMRIECEDYSIIERVLHKFFEDFRLCKKNEIKVDTELFRGIPTIEIEFELFSEMLSKNPRYGKCKLIKS
jgi:dGTP triphosphohydrolase